MRLPSGADTPPSSVVRSFCECARQPSRCVLATPAHAVPPPAGPELRAMIRCRPKPPPCACTVAVRAPNAGTVRRPITPPAALPYSADAFDRTTSTPSTSARSTRSSAVRPSGSVSGMPSIRTRTPRAVPAFDRSPAPRDPKPRIEIRTSPPPVRDWASTPGTSDSASSSPTPRRSRSSRGPTSVTASGTSKMDMAVRDAVTLSGGRGCARVESCAARGAAASIARSTVGQGQRKVIRTRGGR